MEIIALKCLKIDLFSQEKGGSGTLGTLPAHTPGVPMGFPCYIFAPPTKAFNVL